jgi:hypothetical protein
MFQARWCAKESETVFGNISADGWNPHHRPSYQQTAIGVAFTPTKARIAVPDKPKEEVKVGTDIEPIVALDLIMPNGRRMRDCTGAEMKRFGDVLLKRAEQFKKA